MHQMPGTNRETGMRSEERGVVDRVTAMHDAFNLPLERERGGSEKKCAIDFTSKAD